LNNKKSNLKIGLFATIHSSKNVAMKVCWRIYISPGRRLQVRLLVLFMPGEENRERAIMKP